MSTSTAVLETSLATIQRPTAGLVEIHIKADVTVNLQGILEIFTKLDGQGWAGPAKLLVVFPEMPVDFDLPVMSKDHFEGRPAGPNGTTVALAVPDPRTLGFIELHFAYFPAVVSMRIFTTEVEARAWLAPLPD
ncbi:MAG: hypothetical protein ABI432_11585 [Flavobacteriales bacterium]